LRKPPSAQAPTFTGVPPESVKIPPTCQKHEIIEQFRISEQHQVVAVYRPEAVTAVGKERTAPSMALE
jgi:hypothetical protein